MGNQRLKNAINLSTAGKGRMYPYLVFSEDVALDLLLQDRGSVSRAAQEAGPVTTAVFPKGDGGAYYCLPYPWAVKRGVHVPPSTPFKFLRPTAGAKYRTWMLRTSISHLPVRPGTPSTRLKYTWGDHGLVLSIPPEILLKPDEAPEPVPAGASRLADAVRVSCYGEYLHLLRLTVSRDLVDHLAACDAKHHGKDGTYKAAHDYVRNIVADAVLLRRLDRTRFEIAAPGARYCDKAWPTMRPNTTLRRFRDIKGSKSRYLHISSDTLHMEPGIATKVMRHEKTTDGLIVHIEEQDRRA